MTQPSRVLLTVDAVGGVWQYGLDLARGLSARGVDTVIAVLGPSPDTAQRAEAAGIAGATLVDTGLPLDWLCDHAEPVLAAGTAIAALARDMHVDLVQLDMPTLGAAPRDDRAALPTVAVLHGCVPTWWRFAKPDEPLAPEYHWHRRLMREGLGAADRLVAPTASYARIVAREYDLPCAPDVVHNGRTPLPGATGHAVEDRVLTAGRLWDSVKRIALLDAVAARLPVRFEAAGATTGPHGEHASLANLQPLGQLDAAALGARLAGRPVFVSAASFEPFGLAVLEAAHAACALVLSDIASFRELWDGAALFIAGEDEAGYAAAIGTLLEDRALRLRLGEAARARASRYTPQAMADAMLAVYADALGERGRVAA